MFRSALIIAGLVALSLGASLGPSAEPVAIVSQEGSVNADGSFQYSFETADGTKAQQTGQQKTVGAEEVNSVQGSFTYVDKDGQSYTITYVADENGFQPQGAHLPEAPAIPEAIQRALDYNAAHPEEDNL